MSIDRDIAVMSVNIKVKSMHPLVQNTAENYKSGYDTAQKHKKKG